MIDVVEAEPQDRTGDRRRVALEIGAGILTLLDDYADQRQQAPHDEQRDGKEYVTEGADEVAVERARHGAHAESLRNDPIDEDRQRFSSGKMIQIESS